MERCFCCGVSRQPAPQLQRYEADATSLNSARRHNEVSLISLQSVASRLTTADPGVKYGQGQSGPSWRNPRKWEHRRRRWLSLPVSLWCVSLPDPHLVLLINDIRRNHVGQRTKAPSLTCRPLFQKSSWSQHARLRPRALASTIMLGPTNPRATMTLLQP